MVSWMRAGAASRSIQGACEGDQMQQVFSIDRRKWSYMGATNPWLLQPSMDCSQGGCPCRGADGRAECGKRGTSWGPNRNSFRKSATVTTWGRNVPVSLPSSIFDFVLGTSPSWSPKVYALHSRTLYLFEKTRVQCAVRKIMRENTDTAYVDTPLTGEAMCIQRESWK